MNKEKKWTPGKDTLTVVFINMAMALGLIGATWALMSGRMIFSQVQTLMLFAAGILFIGLCTYLAAVNRPWWPRTDLAKEGERTKRRVEREWDTAIKLAQKITVKLDKEIKRRGAASSELDTRDLVIYSLSRQTLKTIKAALTLIQSGFPEVAFCAWRTIFEMRVNAQYISKRNPRVFGKIHRKPD